MAYRFKEGDRVRVNPLGKFGHQSSSGIGTVTQVHKSVSDLNIDVDFDNGDSNCYDSVNLILEDTSTLKNEFYFKAGDVVKCKNPKTHSQLKTNKLYVIDKVFAGRTTKKEVVNVRERKSNELLMFMHRKGRPANYYADRFELYKPKSKKPKEASVSKSKLQIKDGVLVI